MRNINPKEVPERLDPVLEKDVARLQSLLVAMLRRGSMRDPIAIATEDLQLTPTQVHVVMALGNDDGLAMGELSRRQGVTEKTMTGVVDRLEGAGHVTRERDASDRRVVHVHLTSKGRELFLGCRRNVTERIRSLLGLLEEQDRNRLCLILEKLATKLEARAAEAAEEAP